MMMTQKRGGKVWTCDNPKCGRTFNKKYNMQIHQRQHTGEKPYKCGECGLSFKWRSSLTNHQRYHTSSTVHGTSSAQAPRTAQRAERAASSAQSTQPSAEPAPLDLGSKLPEFIMPEIPEMGTTMHHTTQYPRQMQGSSSLVAVSEYNTSTSVPALLEISMGTTAQVTHSAWPSMSHIDDGSDFNPAEEDLHPRHHRPQDFRSPNQQQQQNQPRRNMFPSEHDWEQL